MNKNMQDPAFDEKPVSLTATRAKSEPWYRVPWDGTLYLEPRYEKSTWYVHYQPPAYSFLRWIKVKEGD
jgi:hypothetical protein